MVFIPIHWDCTAGMRPVVFIPALVVALLSLGLCQQDEPTLIPVLVVESLPESPTFTPSPAPAPAVPLDPIAAFIRKLYHKLSSGDSVSSVTLALKPEYEALIQLMDRSKVYNELYHLFTLWNQERLESISHSKRLLDAIQLLELHSY